jgi:HSP20 family protein
MNSIVRWDPLREPASTRSEIDRLFGRVSADGDGMWLPAVDVVEQDELLITAALPGMSADDVDISVEDDQITISGERKQEHEVKKEHYRRFERAYGRFERSFRLPKGVDRDAISATCTNGVLELRIPKTPTAEPRKIAIEAG